MILTGPEIERQVAAGGVVIEPFSTAQINPNSYNVRLGESLLTYSAEQLDARVENPTTATSIPADGLLLMPGEVYLGHTVESIGSTRYVPMIYGRSSVGRLGLFVQITAPIGDLGFLGQWTLMLAPVVPVRVYPRMQIGQIMFFATSGEIELYDGKYQNSVGPNASLLWRSLKEPQ